MSKYRYLLWDVDGTILNFEASEKAAIHSLFIKFQLGTCTEEMIKRYSEINKKYWQALERGEMTKEEILIGRFQEFFSLEGIDVSVAPKFNEEYQVALGDTIVFCDDALEIIKKQKENSKIIVITNGTAVAQKKKLEKSGLKDVVDGIYISEMVGYEKPSVHFFEKVMEKEGITNRKEALIIGDSLTSDIQGGYNMGIDTCWYNPKGIENKSSLIPTYEIRNLQELEVIC